MAVPTSVSDLDATIANNSPSGSDAIGTTLDDYLRAHAGIIRQVSDAKVSAGAITSSGLTVSAADKILGRSSSGSGAVEEITCTSAGRAILDDASASDQRTTLGLGTAATKDTGTSAGNVVVLDGSAKLPAVDGSQLTNIQHLVSDTAKASTSGTAIDFTGIPSWAKQVTIMFAGVSTNGTSNKLLRLGTSGGFLVTGYAATVTSFSSGTLATAARTDGYEIGGVNAADVIHGQIILSNLSGNVWVVSGYTGFSSGAAANVYGGSVNLGATLDRIRITTANGTDAFDAGTINIMYQG